MEKMQKNNLGYLAVSLGFYKTLFSAPGLSTSSEIPENERSKMGLSNGLVRISIGLDNNIEKLYKAIKKCMNEIGRNIIVSIFMKKTKPHYILCLA